MARSSLEDFVLESKLGSGSFGTVYKALRKLDGKHYAIKEIDLRCMSDIEQEDCIKEALALAALDSPYIIKFYDSFLQKGKLYICMEYAAGGNLYDFIRQQSQLLPEDRIWQLFIQMLLGLNYMHSCKVLHRDFKTANVFLDEQLNVRLGDLGVAKVLSDQTANARTMIGTPYYLSPEMCEDKPYNEKSDVWALGVGLYECCAKKHPFDAENQGSLILKILRGKYPPVTGYSKELTDIVKSCLTLDASKRPGTKSLLALESVREHAKQLNLELPPVPTPSKPFPPNPQPSPRPSRPTAVSRVQSRRERDAGGAEQPPAAAAAAAAAAAVPSRSPMPPLGRSPSAVTRVPAAIARVDISADLLPVRPAAPAGNPAAARRRTTTDAAPGALPPAAAAAAAVTPTGQLAKQVQAMKLDPAAARPGSADTTIAAVSQSASDSGQDSNSCEATPLPPDRSQHLQQSLPAVKAQIIVLVGPLAFAALQRDVKALVQSDCAVAVIQGSDSASSTTELPEGNRALIQQQQLPLVSILQRIVPGSQMALVLPLVVKLMYLEAQLGEASSNAVYGNDS